MFGDECCRGCHTLERTCGDPVCPTCGTRIVNRFSRWRRSDGEPISFFPNTLDESLTHPFPELLQPEEHNREQECVLDLMLLAKVESTAAR